MDTYRFQSCRLTDSSPELLQVDDMLAFHAPRQDVRIARYTAQVLQNFDRRSDSDTSALQTGNTRQIYSKRCEEVLGFC